MSDEPICVAVIAPALAVRVGLQALLDDAEEIEVAAEAAEVAALVNLPPEVDILIATSGAGSYEEWRAYLPEEAPRFSVLMITDDPQEVQFLRGLPLHAWGVLSRDASEGELIAAILGLHQGLIVAPPEFLESVLTPHQVGDVPGHIEPLTPRETEVLQLLAQGLANKQIALELGISDHTVKFHISSIYRKLGATNRTEAVRVGMRLGLVLL